MVTKYLGDKEASRIAQNMPYLTRGVWELCLETGVRVSDAVKAKHCDFDEECNFNYIAKKTGKRGKSKVSKDFYNEYIKENKSNSFCFPSPKNVGQHVTRQTVFNHIKIACKRARIDSSGVAPHSARKNFAVKMFHEKGLGCAMAALQHEDVGVTLMYALSDNALTEIMKRLSAVEKSVDKLNRRCRKIEKDVEQLADFCFGDLVYFPCKSDLLDSKKGR